MAAHCLRCGIDVSNEGVCCRDCLSVDPGRCKELKEHAAVRIAAQRASDDLLAGLSVWASGESVRNRSRKKQ